MTLCPAVDTASLADREARYRLLANHATDVVCQLDAISRISWVSPSSTRILARTPESLAEQLFYDLVAPEDVDSLRAALRGVATGSAQGPAVFRILRVDRSAVWVEASASRSDDGLLLVMRDITQRRRLEEQFLEAQRLEAYGQLAGGVAHDFNNALAVIAGNVSLLLKREPGSVEVREMLEEAAAACERASGLTSQLLALGRKQVQKLEVLDLGQAVIAMTRTLGRVIGEDIDFATPLPRERTWVRADAAQLQQVLLNLVLNARDALPKGGRITIATRVRDVDAAFRDLHPGVGEGRWAELSVRDDGVGISSEAMRQLFVPFVNAGAVVGRNGLGLATVLGIVRQSGGHVLVDSSPGTGATFTVLLPEVEPAPATQSLPLAAEQNGRQQTVLLVEDEADVRRVGARILREEGFSVLEASDGVDALRVVGSHPGAIDVLVTDVVMPGLNGREVAEKVQALRNGLKVLFVSGYTNDTVLRAGVSSSTAAFVQKPYTAQSLGQAVRAVLGGPCRAAL